MTIPQPPNLCIDLHCHSTASDGALAPADLVARAVDKGVTHLALTDHDTLNGLPEAAQAASHSGITLVPGIELSCLWKGRTIHVVGLDFDREDPVFTGKVEQQTDNRRARAAMIAERLHRLRVPDLLERATEKAGGDVPGRPHFAEALIEAGVVRNAAQAFKRHLGAGKAGDVRAYWPELPEVVQWITEAGGIAVLAHPRKYRLTATKLRELTTEFCKAGGQGIEVSTSGQSSGDLGFLAELCRRNGMWASQGSDFHFPGAPWCELGNIMKMPDGLEPVWHHFREPAGVEAPAQSGA
ncbi:PHP domain-containing protein [Marinobacter sp. DUT-1]|uniref:PHP domain-containing protein n=1 Tax=Marinobacter sp. DUT-1 TaxID=3412037 RepID=UPI003D174FEC